MNKYGDRIEVWEGRAHMTKGKLTREDLMINKKGKLVSITKHEIGNQLLRFSLREKLCPPICTEIRKEKYNETRRNKRKND
jgi:hypothetical protein